MKLPKWFENQLKKVMEHNNYKPNMLTVEECEKTNQWTPCDLIYREYLNNGGGSAKGFLGLTRANCIKGAMFIKEHFKELVDNDLLSKEGRNNFGFVLWKI